MKLVVLFQSTRHAIRADRKLGEAGVPIDIIPTPRHLSANCGISIAFAEEDRERVTETLTAHHIPFEGPYPLEKT